MGFLDLDQTEQLTEEPACFGLTPTRGSDLHVVESFDEHSRQRTYAVHDFPERERARRDALRRAAQLAGYGLLRPGLLISPDDRWPQLAGRFESDERAGRILHVGLTLPTPDLRTIAATVWNLDALAQPPPPARRTNPR